MHTCSNAWQHQEKDTNESNNGHFKMCGLRNLRLVKASFSEHDVITYRYSIFSLHLP